MSIFGNILGGIVGGLFGMERQNQDQNFATQQNLHNSAEARAMAEHNAALSREMAGRNEAMTREMFGHNTAFAREMAARNEQMQRDFAQMGIQWRVEDAKKAGIHPLAALGTGVTPFSPSAIVSTDAPSSGAIGGTPAHAFAGGGSSEWISDMGQDIGKAVMRSMDVDARAQRQAELEVLKAQAAKDYALASYYTSEGARTSQDMLSSAATPISWPEVGWKSTNVIDRQYLDDTVKAKPEEIASRRSLQPSVSAGVHPGFMEVKTAAGNFLIPRSQDISESLENLWNPVVLLPTIYENIAASATATDVLDKGFRTLDRIGGSVWRGYHGAREWMTDRYESLLGGKDRDKSGRRLR